MVCSTLGKSAGKNDRMESKFKSGVSVKIVRKRKAISSKSPAWWLWGQSGAEWGGKSQIAGPISRKKRV